MASYYRFETLWKEQLGDGRFIEVSDITVLPPDEIQAKRIHAAALRGGWVQPTFHEPHVTDLYHYNHGNGRIVQNGGNIDTQESR